MKEVRYVDDDLYEKKIEEAVNTAIANLSLEGFCVTSQEKQEVRDYFANNIKIRMLFYKKGKNVC